MTAVKPRAAVGDSVPDHASPHFPRPSRSSRYGPLVRPEAPSGEAPPTAPSPTSPSATAQKLDADATTLDAGLDVPVDVSPLDVTPDVSADAPDVVPVDAPFRCATNADCAGNAGGRRL
ncbi:MAG: hypothetical protein IPN17_31595 [Deltaproteobacteria bacterium]|nr:hypothetical protein [Deltaproteobacteria bacterium]